MSLPDFFTAFRYSQIRRDILPLLFRLLHA
jgi:hypothetical protein